MTGRDTHQMTLACASILSIALLFGASSDAAELYGVTGSGGTPGATLHVISQTDASVVPLVVVGDNGGGQAIAWNPDDGCIYHWAGYPSSNAIYERIDLDTLFVSNIPLSGFMTDEISPANPSAVDALRRQRMRVKKYYAPQESGMSSECDFHPPLGHSSPNEPAP